MNQAATGPLQRPRSGAVVALLVAAVTASALTGCVRPQSCVSWVVFDDEQAMFDDAQLVVSGRVGEPVGEVELISGPGVMHEVTVDATFKGEADDVIRVAAPRDYCVEHPPQPADPLRAGDDVLLFLHPVEGRDDVWRTLTSMQGVVPFGPADEPPFDGAPGAGQSPPPR